MAATVRAILAAMAARAIPAAATANTVEAQPIGTAVAGIFAGMYAFAVGAYLARAWVTFVDAAAFGRTVGEHAGPGGVAKFRGAGLYRYRVDAVPLKGAAPGHTIGNARLARAAVRPGIISSTVGT